MLSDMLRQRRVAAEKDHDLDEEDDWVPEDNALDGMTVLDYLEVAQLIKSSCQNER